MSEGGVQQPLECDNCSAHASHTAANHSAACPPGSNVRRLKSCFLQQCSDAREPAASSPPAHHRPAPVPSIPAGADLLDMADHVEKFKHTRALFAQLAEQNSPLRPSPLPRSSLPRSWRSASSASPPPTRPGRIEPLARRSVSPSNDLHNSRSLQGHTQQTQGQTRSCNGVTTWSQLGSRSFDDGSRSGSLVMGSRSQPGSRSSENGFRSQPGVKSSTVETLRSETGPRPALPCRSTAVEPCEAACGVVLRRNRPSLDLTVAAGRAVLLPKRRSREEQSLKVSKVCLEACLSQADEYWRRQHLEELSGAVSGVGDVVDPLMSESTFSSGSGEEMARSESGQDLASVLQDSTVSPTADSHEMWSRRLSAAMDAKNSEDSCRGGAAVDTDHVTSSRSSLIGCDVENSGGRSTDCHRQVCSAADYSQHKTVLSDNGRTICTTGDLSRSSDPSRSLSVNCDLGGSAAVCSTVKGSVTDYNQHVTNNSISQTTAVNLSTTSEASGTYCDIEHPAVMRGSAADYSSCHVTTSVSNSCVSSRGSVTDCDTPLEGSVTDCECKDVGTEKSSSSSSLRPISSHTNCDQTVISSSHISDDNDDDDDDGARMQRQREGMTVANVGLHQSVVEDISSCNTSHCCLQSHQTNEVCSVHQLITATSTTTATSCVNARLRGHTVVEDDVVQACGSTQSTCVDGLPEAADADNVSVSHDKMTDAVSDSHPPQSQHDSLSSLTAPPTTVHTPLITPRTPGSTVESGAVCLEQSVNVDPMSLVHHITAGQSAPEAGAVISYGPAAGTLSQETAGRTWFRQQNGVAAAGTPDHVEAGTHAPVVDSEAGTQANDDVQAMSVSEDEESSGETDYVVLGEPVSKQTSTTEAVKQTHQHNLTTT